MNRRAISTEVWDGIRAEFTLPALAQVHRRLAELMEHPEPVRQRLVRVFIDDGTFCPGFQFLPGGQLHPTVLTQFQRALELDIPHNCFTAWMVTPYRDLAGDRDGRMHDCLADLEQRNGTACLKLMAIALTRVYSKPWTIWPMGAPTRTRKLHLNASFRKGAG